MALATFSDTDQTLTSYNALAAGPDLPLSLPTPARHEDGAALRCQMAAW